MSTNSKLNLRIKKAFTLLEVMLAMFVVISGTMAVLSLSSMSTRASKQSEIRSVALAMARKEIERLKGMSVANRLGADKAEFVIPANLKNQFASGARGLKFSGEYSVQTVPGDPNMQQITVTVKWRRVTEGLNFDSAPWSEVTLSTLATTQPVVISYTGVIDPPPPTPPTSGGTTGYVDPTTGSTGYVDPTTGSTGTTGSPGSTGEATTGEVGGCTYTYGPC